MIFSSANLDTINKSPNGFQLVRSTSVDCLFFNNYLNPKSYAVSFKDLTLSLKI